ncbi:MAG TPA: hypothetical protein VFA59_06955 [Vicinamibacterales bacterium]|nr:hypothetical protein [Vicinamibacterales bacterium]
MWTCIAAPAIRVLFVGNSLTTVNNLPELVQRLAAAGNQKFEYRIVAFDGYSLEDHWNRGDARRAIAEGGWSYVVLQQGPSALPESRVLLIDYARRFASEARRVGAEPALYMVWPTRERRGDVDGVRYSYESAAKETHALLLPVGEAFRAAQRADARVRLFGADGFHPTMAGSFLGALVMFETMFGARAPALIPPGVTPEDNRVLRSASEAVVKRVAR